MKLLVAGTWQPAERERAALAAMGHTALLLPQEDDPLPPTAAEVEGIIGNRLFLHHPPEAFPRLRTIQLTSAGRDHIPRAWREREGLIWHTAAGVYAIPMAEFAVGVLLGIYKEWDRFRDCQAAHRWKKHRGLRELYGKQICIVGCGQVGNACAERLGAFGCVVTGITAHPRADARYARMDAPACLRTQLSEADAVILSLPLTSETHHCIGARELACLRDGAVLINLSRGGVLDTAALLAAVASRPLYAALDVQETEPLPPDSPLWDAENVLITPHNAFVGDGNQARLWALILDNLRACDA